MSRYQLAVTRLSTPGVCSGLIGSIVDAKLKAPCGKVAHVTVNVDSATARAQCEDHAARLLSAAIAAAIVDAELPARPRAQMGWAR